MTVHELILALIALEDVSLDVVWGQDEDPVTHIEEQPELKQVVLFSGGSTKLETTLYKLFTAKLT